MKRLARTLGLTLAVALSGSLAALAGSYTVRLASGELYETRYPPRFNVRDVEFLTEGGTWVTVPRESVLRVTNGDAAASGVRMIDANTVAVGWAPNDLPAAGRGRASSDSAALDPVALLVIALAARPSLPQQDFSVAQFVDTEELTGGIPADGVYYFRVAEQRPVEELLGLPPGGLRQIQGLPPDRNLIETLQAMPPGGLRAIQGLAPVGSLPGPSPAAPGLAPGAASQ